MVLASAEKATIEVDVVAEVEVVEGVDVVAEVDIVEVVAAE